MPVLQGALYSLRACACDVFDQLTFRTHWWLVVLQLEINEDFGKPHKLAKVKAAVQSVMAQRQRQNNMLGAVADAVRR